MIWAKLICYNRLIQEGKVIGEALKKVASDGQARRNQVKKRSLRVVVNEHFEPDFNIA